MLCSKSTWKRYQGYSKNIGTQDLVDLLRRQGLDSTPLLSLLAVKVLKDALAC